MKLFKSKDNLERLGELIGDKEEEVEKKKEKAQPLSQFDAAVSKGKTGSNIARNLARADLKLRVIEFIGLKILAALAGIGLGLYLGRADVRAMAIAALVGAILFSFIPEMYVKFRAGKRVKTFNGQLGDTITMMANSLRGGYSFLQTMDLVSKEAPEPTAAEFKRVVQEVGLGRSTTDALNNLVRRMPSDDLDLLITAVNIQHEVGGNLAQILDSIGHTIRERVRIKGEINTLTAQGRLSGYVITGLPIAMAGYITLVNPEYMMPLFKFGLPPEAWCCLPVTSLVLIAIGYVVMMKIVDIEV
jgi:tight adherence protein B